MSTKTQSRRRSLSASEMISFQIFGISVPLSFFPQSGVVKAHKNSEKERTGFEKRKAGPSEKPSLGVIDLCVGCNCRGPVFKAAIGSLKVSSLLQAKVAFLTLLSKRPKSNWWKISTHYHNGKIKP